MSNTVSSYRDAIFLITAEQSCPLYSIGDELKVEGFSLSVSGFKPGCLQLTSDLKEIVTATESFTTLPVMSNQKSRFQCSGCSGTISFEYKKEKDFATLQMKLLQETEERRKRKHLEQFFSELRGLPIFDPLDDDNLSDLTVLLELTTVPMGKAIVKQDEPGRNLYIIISGEAEIKDEDGTRTATLKSGDIFGEMSILSGEPFPKSLATITHTRLALLSSKNFRHILKKLPVLQLFFFKLFVDRAQSVALQAGTITSGMTGNLSEIGIVDLLQLINSSQKTGVVEFTLTKAKAVVFFNEGEIIYVRYQNYRNKEALSALIGQSDGSFTYNKGIPEELLQLPPIGGFMALIMEGLQTIDEA